MPLKRFVVCTTAFASALSLLGLGLTTAAQAARTFPLTGGGAQLHIGNGLALPIQAAIPNFPLTPTMFPTLLVPAKAAQFVVGSTGKPLLTAMSTVSGPVTKSGYQRRLKIPAGVLSKPAVQKTVGVKFSNPTVFAVGTNVNYVWPAAPATFSVDAAVGGPVIAAFGGTMTYSNTLGHRFGGPANFVLAPGVGGIIPAPVTVYIKINGTTPPCTHPAFAGGAAGCVAGILQALPTGLFAIGAATPTTYMTPGGMVAGMNLAAMKMGAVPLGTVLAKALVATVALPTNMATSQPGSWTTGQVIISNPAAGGMGEKFTLSGMDARGATGAGTIQLVSGSLSKRTASGPNANRGWLRLILGPGLPKVPSMSPMGFAAAAALMLLGFGYATRRRLFA